MELKDKEKGRNNRRGRKEKATNQTKHRLDDA